MQNKEDGSMVDEDQYKELEIEKIDYTDNIRDDVFAFSS